MWPIARALQTPIDSRINEIANIPYTISYVIRKRIQIDSLSEFPKEKRPPDEIIWFGTSEELDEWIEKVFNPKYKDDTGLEMDLEMVEG